MLHNAVKATFQIPLEKRERKDLLHLVQFIEGLQVFSIFDG